MRMWMSRRGAEVSRRPGKSEEHTKQSLTVTERPCDRDSTSHMPQPHAMRCPAQTRTSRRRMQTERGDHGATTATRQTIMLRGHIIPRGMSKTPLSSPRSNDACTKVDVLTCSIMRTPGPLGQVMDTPSTAVLSGRCMWVLSIALALSTRCTAHLSRHRELWLRCPAAF